jgi:hypothetical protein
MAVERTVECRKRTKTHAHFYVKPNQYIFVFYFFQKQKQYMPYSIRKLPRQDLYRVRNTETGDIKANATTKEKAEAMVRLLNAVNRGWKPSR